MSMSLSVPSEEPGSTFSPRITHMSVSRGGICAAPPAPWHVQHCACVRGDETLCLFARDAHVRREEVFRAAGEGCLQAAGGSCRLPAPELEVTGGEKGCLARWSPHRGALQSSPILCVSTAVCCTSRKVRNLPTSSDERDGGSTALSEAGTHGGRRWGAESQS